MRHACRISRNRCTELNTKGSDFGRGLSSFPDAVFTASVDRYAFAARSLSRSPKARVGSRSEGQFRNGDLMINTAPRAGTRRGRTIGRLSALGTASLLAAGLLAGCSSPTPTPGESGGSSPEASVPRPTPSAAPAPQPVGVVIPGDCEQIYGPSMFEALQEDLPPLNDPSMADPNFSNTDELEELLRSLEYLQCTWGGAGDMGIVTAVARTTEAQSAQAIETMESNDFDCYQQLQGTRCVTREEGDGYVLGESHFLRDDVWLSTFWSNAPIRGYTESMVGAIWP